MICIPITGKTQSEAFEQIEMSLPSADVLELRMDLIRDGDLCLLIKRCRSAASSVKILVTNRRTGFFSEEEFSGERKRVDLLKEAVDLGVDYVDMEVDTPEPFRKELLSLVKARDNRTRVIVSHHDFRKTPPDKSLRSIFHDCMMTDANIIKIVTYAGSPEDNLTVLSLIPYARSKNREIIAFCMGEEGRVSRIAAPSLGSYLSYVSLHRTVESAPGQLTVNEMEQIMKITAGGVYEEKKTALPADMQVFCLFGNPVKHSLSPLMHEAALARMKIAGRYVPFCIHDLASAVNGIKGMGIRGVSVTIPFKVSIMAHLDEVDDDSLEIGAVNTIVNCHGKLMGFNTDWIGLVQSLKDVMDMKGKVFAVLGAGGAARAAAFGIRKEGGITVIVNRNTERGRSLAQELRCSFYPLGEIDKVRADCLINTTPVGMMPNIDETPVDGALLVNYRWVMDLIYNPLKTRLLADAEKAGCVTISGLGMFVHQGAEQIKLWTGLEPPRDFMKQVVRERLLYGN